VDRFTILPEDGEVDPRQVMSEAGAPDDVGDLEDAVVLEDGSPSSDADRSRDPDDVRPRRGPSA